MKALTFFISIWVIISTTAQVFKPIPIKDLRQRNTTVKVLDSVVYYSYDNVQATYIPVDKISVLSRIPGAQYLVHEEIHYLYEISSSSYFPHNYHKYEYFSHQPNAEIKKYLEKPWNSSILSWDDTIYYIALTGFYNHFFDMQIQEVNMFASYNYSTNEFLYGEKYVYDISQDTLINNVFIYKLNTSTMQYELYAKYTISYNLNNLPTHWIYYTYDPITQTYLPTLKNTYTLNANNKIIEELTQSWNGSTWDNMKRIINTYNAQNLLTTSIYQNWDNVTLNWQNIWKEEFAYNNANLITAFYSYSWSTTWIPSFGYTQDYDTQGNLIELVYYTNDGINFLQYLKYIYTYNTYNQLINTVTYFWDTSSSSFIPSSNTINFYTNNLIDSTIYQYWDNSIWVDNYKTIYTYDTDSDLVIEVSFSYDSSTSTWTPVYKKQWFYSQLDATNIAQQQNSQITIFPNPTKDYLYVKIDNISNLQSISIIDINGKILKNSTNQHLAKFDVTDLPTGKYFVRVQNKLGKTELLPFIKL